MKNKKIIYLLLLLVVFWSGFFTYKLTTPSLEEVPPNPYKALSSITQGVPECFLGHCPQYFTWDVNGDSQMSDSIVVIPTAMTKGAGKVWVIDKGRLVFDSGELMDVWVEEPEDHQGFYLLYKTDINNPVSHKVKFTYRDGVFSIADEEAIRIVKNLPEIKDFLQRMEKAKVKTLVEANSGEPGEINVQVAEINIHNLTATFNWYILNSNTGIIKCSLVKYEGTKYVGNNDNYPNCD